MIDNGDDQLSATGRARREAMLNDLIAAMRRTHRHRSRRRRAAGTLAIVLVVIGCVWAAELHLPGASQTTHVVGRRPIGPSSAVDSVVGKSAPAVRIVRHDHRTGRVRVIGDDGLLRLLDDLGRSAGLIRSEGRAWLTNAVADARRGRSKELGPQPGAL